MVGPGLSSRSLTPLPLCLTPMQTVSMCWHENANRPLTEMGRCLEILAKSLLRTFTILTKVLTFSFQIRYCCNDVQLVLFFFSLGSFLHLNNLNRTQLIFKTEICSCFLCLHVGVILTWEREKKDLRFSGIWSSKASLHQWCFSSSQPYLSPFIDSMTRSKSGK